MSISIRTSEHPIRARTVGAMISEHGRTKRLSPAGRTCENCGAILRRTNPGHTCDPCERARGPQPVAHGVPRRGTQLREIYDALPGRLGEIAERVPTAKRHRINCELRDLLLMGLVTRSGEFGSYVYHRATDGET